MHRARIEGHLTAAENHIALGLKQIARQRHIIVELHRDGHDTPAVTEVLLTLEASHRQHLSGRDRILEELGLSGQSERTI
jgi:hypothetical protein